MTDDKQTWAASEWTASEWLALILGVLRRPNAHTATQYIYDKESIDEIVRVLPEVVATLSRVSRA